MMNGSATSGSPAYAFSRLDLVSLAGGTFPEVATGLAPLRELTKEGGANSHTREYATTGVWVDLVPARSHSKPITDDLPSEARI